MKAPIMKRGDLISVAYLEWIRAQPCYFGSDSCEDSQPHHFPTKGRSGLVNDLSVIPVCGVEHDRCHGITVVKDGVRLEPIAEALQHTAVLVTFWRFWDQAPISTKQLVLADIIERDRARVWIPL